MRTIVALTALLSLPLAGCVSGFKSNLPTAQVYVLQPPLAPLTSAVTSPATPLTATVQVPLPIAGAGLATDGIAVLRSGERLDYYSAARWAAAAPVMLQVLAIEAVRGTHRFSMVESDAGPFSSAYVLSLELPHFEAQYGDGGPPTVHVALVCTLGRRGDSGILVSFTVESHVTADADHLQAVVAAFEKATADVLAQMAANIAPLITQAPQSQ